MDHSGASGCGLQEAAAQWRAPAGADSGLELQPVERSLQWISFFLEGLHPLERADGGVVLEEFYSVGKTQVEPVHKEVSHGSDPTLEQGRE